MLKRSVSYSFQESLSEVDVKIGNFIFPQQLFNAGKSPVHAVRNEMTVLDFYNPPVCSFFMHPYFSERFGNPSSLHHVGDEATKVLEDSREKVYIFD